MVGRDIRMTSEKRGNGDDRKIRLKAREDIVSGGKRGKIADYLC